MLLMARIDLAGAWRGMTDRERALVAALVSSFLAMLTGLVAFFVIDGLSELEDRNVTIAEARGEIERGGEAWLAARAQGGRDELRPAPALQGYLEQAAQAAGIEIPESTERPPQPRGRTFLERSVELKLRKVTVHQLADFLRRIESGEHTIKTTRLWVRTRFQDHESLDVEMTVSTWERQAPGKADDKGARAGAKGKET